MKNPIFHTLGLIILLACGFTQGARAAEAKAATPTKAAAASIAVVPPEPEIPKSTFTTTASTKDPFYPNSTRHTVIITTSAPVTLDAKWFTLRGLAGPSDARMAIINNNYPLKIGESANVPIPALGTRKMIRVLKIADDDTVTIQVDGFADPIEIRQKIR